MTILLAQVRRLLPIRVMCEGGDIFRLANPLAEACSRPLRCRRLAKDSSGGFSYNDGTTIAAPGGGCMPRRSTGQEAMEACAASSSCVAKRLAAHERPEERRRRLNEAGGRKRADAAEERSFGLGCGAQPGRPPSGFFPASVPIPSSLRRDARRATAQPPSRFSYASLQIPSSLRSDAPKTFRLARKLLPCALSQLDEIRAASVLELRDVLAV